MIKKSIDSVKKFNQTKKAAFIKKYFRWLFLLFLILFSTLLVFASVLAIFILPISMFVFMYLNIFFPKNQTISFFWSALKTSVSGYFLSLLYFLIFRPVWVVKSLSKFLENKTFVKIFAEHSTLYGPLFMSFIIFGILFFSFWIWTYKRKKKQILAAE